MPKPKPDQTIRHEIVLSRPDRELLSDVVVAYQINKVATPIVSLLSDASAMLIVAGLLEAYGITDLIPNTVYDDIVGGIYDTYQGGMAAIEGALEFAEGVGDEDHHHEDELVTDKFRIHIGPNMIKVILALALLIAVIMGDSINPSQFF
jgi:hypothetical protein